MTIAREVAAARAIDGAAPSQVVHATDAAEVARTLGEADAAGEAVVLWGGGTRITVGDRPSRYDIALDLTGVSGIVAHEPADLVCAVRAGTTLAALADALAGAGQRWPVEAPDPGRATVGGTIASAAAGPSRLRFQHPRDWVIGCEAVLGDGTRARAGGRVVKNVTGFDLTRLYAGTYGTLAALVEVSLKLVALDASVRTLRIEDGDSERLARIAAQLRASLPLDGIVLAVDASRSRLLVRVAGASAAVERVSRDVRAAGVRDETPPEEWQELIDRTVGEDVVARCAVTPGREAEVLGTCGVAYVGTGVAYRFGGTEADLATLRARCEASGGALIVERGDAIRRAIGTWGTLRAPSGVGSALKARLDPRAALAPARIPV